MAIHTSAITYSRGVPKNAKSNFFFVAQANNAMVHPINIYLRNYSFYNRNIINPSKLRWPWSH
jgi:hypothetical protein